MVDSSSGSDSQQIGQYSTPQSDVKTLSCSISSISDEALSADKRVISNRKYIIYNQDEDTDPIFGDPVREHTIIPRDIQSVDMKQLFHRTEDVTLHKTAYEPSSLLKVLPPPLEVVPQYDSSDDDLFDGKVGEHHRTYTRTYFHDKRVSLEKEQNPFYSVADFLWKNFVENDVELQSRKKKKFIQFSPVKTEPKFFKTRHQKSEQKNKVDRVLPKRKRVNNLYFGYSGLFMPSLKRPLGWMAIRGIGIVERLKVCNELVNFSEDEPESYQPLAKKRRSNKSTEYLLL